MGFNSGFKELIGTHRNVLIYLGALLLMLSFNL